MTEFLYLNGLFWKHTVLVLNVHKYFPVENSKCPFFKKKMPFFYLGSHGLILLTVFIEKSEKTWSCGTYLFEDPGKTFGVRFKTIYLFLRSHLSTSLFTKIIWFRRLAGRTNFTLELHNEVWVKKWPGNTAS